MSFPVCEIPFSAEDMIDKAGDMKEMCIDMIGSDCWGIVITRANGSSEIKYCGYDEPKIGSSYRNSVCDDSSVLFGGVNLGDVITVYMSGNHPWKFNLSITDSQAFDVECFMSQDFEDSYGDRYHSDKKHRKF